MDAASPSDAEAARRAVRALANEKANQNNAALQILAARINFDKEMQDRDAIFSAGFSGVSDKNAAYQILQKRVDTFEARLQTAFDAAGGIDAATGKRTNAVDRAEGAYVSRQAAEIYDRLGEKDRAAERRLMARAYEVSEAERSTLPIKLGRPRVALDGTIFGGGYFQKYTPTDLKINPQMDNPDYAGDPATREFGEDPFKRETNTFKIRYKIVTQRTQGNEFEIKTEADKGKGYIRPHQIEGSLKTEGTRDIYSVENTIRQKKGRIIESTITTTDISETYKGTELNSSGTVRAATMSSTVGVIDEWNKWITTKVEMDKATARIDARDQAFFRDRYPIPPEPKDLPRIRLRMESQLGKQKAAPLMKSIEEYSYAFYGK